MSDSHLRWFGSVECRSISVHREGAVSTLLGTPLSRRNAAGELAGVSEDARNIARQKRAEEAVRISEKLEAVGVWLRALRIMSTICWRLSRIFFSFCRTKTSPRKQSVTWQPHIAKYREWSTFRRRLWVSAETAEGPSGLRSLPFSIKHWHCTITASKCQASNCCAIMTRP